MRAPKRLVLVALMGIVVLAACGGSDSESAGDGGGGDGLDAARAPESVADYGGGSSGGGGEPAPRSALPDVGARIIKTADVSLELGADGFQDSFHEAIATAERHGGFVLSTSVQGQEARSGRIVLRIPSVAFEAALGELKDLGEVRSETVSGEDVSQEFIDLEARIRNLRAQESVLLGLMDRAKTIAGTIRVQNELQSVQLEIEQLQGRLRFLEDRTSLSTISIRMSETGALPSEPSGVFDRAWRLTRDISAWIASAVVLGAGALFPVMVLLLMVAVAVKVLRPLVARFLT